jgi:glycosyltransferase involved in cell wall biosynthesis
MLVSEFRARSLRDCVFQSTYFTYLEAAVAQVAIVYDMNHERFREVYDLSEWGQWLRRQYRTYVERATRVIAISEQTRRDIVQFYGIPPERIDVTPLAVSRKLFWPDRSLEQAGVLIGRFGIERPFLLYVGLRDARYKNFGRLLTAFAESGLAGSLLLVVAGAKWNDEEERLVKASGVAANVRLVVQPEAGVLRNLYSSSLAFVYPSRFEGFGIPLLEAMACETFVLAADTPVFHEVGGDAPVYFDAEDTKAMARTLRAALDSNVRAAHIALGRERVKGFTWDRCARETFAVYQKALAAPRAH